MHIISHVPAGTVQYLLYVLITFFDNFYKQLTKFVAYTKQNLFQNTITVSHKTVHIIMESQVHLTIFGQFSLLTH